MSRHPDVADLVRALVGTWEGTGSGLYPTIDPFEYRERLTITERTDHPALHYEQRTWRRADQDEVVSHWETGLLRVSSDCSARLANAQPGRAETMGGRWEVVPEGWLIELAGTGFAGDDRMVASTRRLQVGHGTLDYVMHMETTATGELSLHLDAELARTEL